MRFSASPRRPQPAVSIRSVTGARVVLYHAEGCHLCERARDVMRVAGVDFQEIDIGGDPKLESRYREWLPVVEIDGERAFVYYVDADALRRKIAAQS